MDRAYASGAAGIPPAPPASPSIGYPQQANPGLGAPATKPGKYWYYMITEEIRGVIAAAGITPDQADVTQLSDAISAMITAQAPRFPAGAIIDYSGPTAPAGFLACPTSATTLNRTTYADLFAAIGTTWGVGDGATTFGMPWFPPDYASVQANANVGTATVGAVISHSHTLANGQNPATVASGVYAYQSLGGQDGATSAIAPTGGAANLAAGHRNLKCVKY